MLTRKPSTTKAGTCFSQKTIDAVWEKAKTVPGYDPAIFRRDGYGAWIKRSSYGTTGGYGWEVDHIKPVSEGGGDEFPNLQPLHWKNNRHKSEKYPSWGCAISAI